MNVHLSALIWLILIYSCVSTHEGNSINAGQEMKLSCSFDHRFDYSDYRVVTFTFENTGFDPFNLTAESFSVPGDSASVINADEISELRQKMGTAKSSGGFPSETKTLAGLLAVEMAYAGSGNSSGGAGAALAGAVQGGAVVVASYLNGKTKPIGLGSKHLLGSGVRILPGEVIRKQVVLASANWMESKHFTLCLNEKGAGQCYGGQLITYNPSRPKECRLQDNSISD